MRVLLKKINKKIKKIYLSQYLMLLMFVATIIVSIGFSKVL